jgi:cyclic-di-AMP phosphodiesterase PgpH
MRPPPETPESAGGKAPARGIVQIARDLIVRTIQLPDRRPLLMRWVLLAVVFLCGLTVFPRQEGYQRTIYRVGTVQPRAIIAEFGFPILQDATALERQQQQAMAAVPPVLVLQDSVQVEALSALAALQTTIADLRRNQMPATQGRQRDVSLSQNAYLALLTLDADAVMADARARLKEYFDRGIVPETLEDLLNNHDRAALLSGGMDWVGPTSRFAGPNRIRRELEDLVRTGTRGQAVAELVERFAWPNIAYDNQATQERRLLARDAVDPAVGQVLKGEKIIGAHEIVTPEAAQKLESYESARESRGARLRLQEHALAFVGRAMLLAFLLCAFVLYLRAYRRELVRSFGDALLLALAFSSFLLLGALVLNVLRFSGYLIPVAGFAVLITLLYDERLAFAATAFLAGVIGLLTNEGPSFVIIIGFGSVAAILSVHQLRDRRQLYRLLLYVPLVHLAALLALGLLNSLAFEEVLSQALYLVANPFIAAGFALFAVPISEQIFGRCTNLTLLELLDLNRPLLRRLMLEAPGTYHHSLMVGTLAEAGASAIGANPLMARVQGYHHDIGKIKKPEYFIENQMAGRRNPHDKLAPTMSRLILESHVRDGVLLARENKLPRVVRDAIAQHHGTSLMTFFYHRARQKDPQVPDTEYRYPGPRPRSRELGIVLLADQIDAAARSLDEPTPSRLRGVVKQLIEKRVLDGELDDSSLTLKDLAAVRDAFAPILMGLFHGRISYPKMEQGRGKTGTGAVAEPAAKAEAG